jgi:hypothetical protein
VRILNEEAMREVIEKFHTYGKQDLTEAGLDFGGKDLPDAVARGS